MEKKSFFIQEKIDGFLLLIIKIIFERMHGFGSSALVSCLVERLIRPKDFVKRNDVVALFRRRFLKRLFFLRKIRSGQNIFATSFQSNDALWNIIKNTTTQHDCNETESY
jgi:hypothetical protein